MRRQVISLWLIGISGLRNKVTPLARCLGGPLNGLDLSPKRGKLVQASTHQSTDKIVFILQLFTDKRFMVSAP